MNLLFIFSDQHSRETLGCYGNSYAVTPNLDKLADEGTVFENAYSNSPVCVPARACMATGRYVHQTKCYDNASPYTGENFKSFGHRLTENGYKVATVGKLHYRSTEDDIGFPNQIIPLHIKNGVGDLFGSIREEHITKPSLPKYIKEAGVGESAYIDYDTAIGKEAANYIKEAAKESDKPWMLQVGFASPHHPWTVPQKYFDMISDDLPMPERWEEKDWPMHPSVCYRRKYRHMEQPFTVEQIKQARKSYYALCAFIDDQIGVIIDSLKESGQYENTMIVYSTDHGEMLGNLGLWYKHLWYENASGIPLIMAGKGIQKGARNKTNVSLVDLFPTFVEACDAKLLPEDETIDGKSILDLAKTGKEEKRVVFGEYHGSASAEGSFMVKDGEYKYIYTYGMEAQLFNVAKDPFESEDLINNPEYKGIKENLHKLLYSYIDPDVGHKEAKESQRARIDMHGGYEKVVGKAFTVSPPPEQFGTANIHSV